MREIKKYVRFYIQKRKTWTDQSPRRPRPVVMMFNYDGKRLCTLTGLKIAECDWDASKQRVKLNVKRAKQVNGVFDLLEEKVNDIYYDAIGNGITPDNNHILRELKKDKKKEKLSLIDEWKRYLEIIKINIKESSLESLTISFNHFEKFARGMRLDFDDITGELVSKYAAYLQKLGQGDNTVYKNVKRLRMFMNYAKKAGLHNNINYNDFNVNQKSKRIVFLEWSEVKILLDYKPKTPMESKALDNFLFGCLTAMRYIDYHSLKRADVSEVRFAGVDGAYHSASYRQVKTGKLNVVPLLPEAMAIIERNMTAQGDFALPRLSNQKINETIKEVARRAGLQSMEAVDEFKKDICTTKYVEKWRLLSTHIGRKTFISVAAAKGIPIHIVASIAGHSVKTCMKFYAGVADQDKFVRVMKEMKFSVKENSEEEVLT
jgi:site-specific recombinase XerD